MLFTAGVSMISLRLGCSPRFGREYTLAGNSFTCFYDTSFVFMAYGGMDSWDLDCAWASGRRLHDVQQAWI